MENKPKQGIKYLKALANIAVYAVALVILIAVVPKLIVFFMPFVIGFIISALANPLVRFFEKKIKTKRKATSAVVIIVILAFVITVVYLVGYVLISQCVEFATSLPAKWPSIESEIDQLGAKINSYLTYLPKGTVSSLNNFAATIEDYVSDLISSLSKPTVTAVSNIAKGLPSMIIGVIMCILSAYFFTAEHNNLSDGMVKFIPKRAYEKLDTVLRGLKRAVGGYFLAQVKIEIWVYFVILIGLFVLKVDYAIVIALGIAFLDFLPFFGAGLVMIPWSVIAFTNADYFVGIGMLVVWGLGQLIRQIIQPKIVGDSVGLAPLPTLFLLFVGFEIKGVIGMIIAVPIGIIAASLYEEGLFRGLTDSIKILWNGISTFRKFTPEELGIEKGEEDK
ncbi:MAG: sporulation integral membrane protein YtvI [Lachnospiraceae bacterium]|nr:sporulation integral membrane protein YtvI [Lachnospiraceae bacterium]